MRVVHTWFRSMLILDLIHLLRSKLGSSDLSELLLNLFVEGIAAFIAFPFFNG